MTMMMVVVMMMMMMMAMMMMMMLKMMMMIRHRALQEKACEISKPSTSLHFVWNTSLEYHST
eukprot:6462925-Karenia_brevis.AAC.1